MQHHIDSCLVPYPTSRPCTFSLKWLIINGSLSLFSCQRMLMVRLSDYQLNATDRHDILSHWVWAVPIILIVAALAIRQIDMNPPTYDEFYSMFNVGWIINGPTCTDRGASIPRRNSANHTPLYFLLLNLWGHLVGNAVAMGRTLTIFTGLLSLAITYRLAARFCRTDRRSDCNNSACKQCILQLFLCPCAHVSAADAGFSDCDMALLAHYWSAENRKEERLLAARRILLFARQYACI